MKKIKISKETLFIGLIILLGGFLRFYLIRNYIVFLGDEGRDALVVYNILHGNLTLLGPTSSVGGFFLGPIYYYMMAPFLWLTHYDPVGPAIMVGIIGLITIYLVYLFGKEIFNSKAGLIAALLYAISPTVIIYSRSSWNPNVFPFFTVASLFALYKAVATKKWWFFVLAGLLMGINMQIHYLATFVGAIMFIYITFVDFRMKVAWLKELIKRYLLMLGGFIVGFSPFLAFEARHQFANSQNIINFVLNSKETGVAGDFGLNAMRAFERVFPGLLISYPKFQDFLKYDPVIIKLWYFLGIGIGVIIIAFFLYNFYKNYKDRKIFQKYFLIFVWAFVGIGLFLFYKKSIYDYYLGFVFPIPFLLMGFFLSKVSEEIKKFGIVLLIAALIPLVYINLKFTPILIPGNQQVNQMKMISDFVLSKTNDRPYNFAISGGGNSPHAYLYFFKLAGRDPVAIQGIDIDPNRNSVTDQLFVVCEQLPCSPLGESGQDIAGFGRAEIDDEWNVSVSKIYKLKHYSGE